MVAHRVLREKSVATNFRDEHLLFLTAGVQLPRIFSTDMERQGRSRWRVGGSPRVMDRFAVGSSSVVPSSMLVKARVVSAAWWGSAPPPWRSTLGGGADYAGRGLRTAEGRGAGRAGRSRMRVVERRLLRTVAATATAVAASPVGLSGAKPSSARAGGMVRRPQGQGSRQRPR